MTKCMHACKNKVMKTIPQYTIRKVPPELDQELRRRAQKSGKSLNQTIIQELSEKLGIAGGKSKQTIGSSLDWFIGSGIDQETLDALGQADREDKAIAAREGEKIDEIIRQLNQS